MSSVSPAFAHVGSPDVFLDASAGPYRLYITVRPPLVVPGVADVEVLATSDEVTDVRIVPLPLSGPGAQFAPVPDRAERSREDPRLFVGRLWMMTAGAWQVRVAASGARGAGQVSVPVPTLPQSTRTMTRATGALLAVFMVLLCAGFVSIAASAVRESTLEAGSVPPPRARRRGRIAAVIATAVVGVAIVLGGRWWDAEAASYARYVYKPLEAAPAIARGELTLTLRDPGWLRTRRTDDFVADHGHLMHLFVVTPALDRLWHLHPAERVEATFAQRLPSMPAGRYEAFGDLVHETGVPETVVSEFETGAIDGAPLAGDDSAWRMPAGGALNASESPLQSGGRVIRVRDSQPLVPKKLTVLTFRIEDGNGKPATDLELYMGMPGHAVIVRKDRKVFAHVHPSGSAPMAAVQIAARGIPGDPDDPHAQHATARDLPPVVSFPYGFPEAGDYRVFVQIKRSGVVETAAFGITIERELKSR